MDLATDDVLRNLARQSAHVTQKLQELLDAQSDGLLKGLGREPESRSPSAGEQRYPRSVRSRTVSPGVQSSIYRDDPLTSLETPSSSVIYHAAAPRSSRKKVIPVRQPPPSKPPTLREARKGIAESLQALATIRGDEARFHNVRAQKGEEGIERIQSLIEKREGLQGQISGLEDQGRIEREEEGLRQQEHHLETEIRSLEERLSDLRAELRHVRTEREERSNSRAAEASSFRNALADVQRTIRVEILSDQGQYKRMKASTREGVWSLPANRRTAELVKEDIQAQVKEDVDCEKSASAEGKACDEGAVVWNGFVSELSALEKRLGVEIKKLNNPRSMNDSISQSMGNKNATGSDVPDSQQGSEGGMVGVLDLMNTTVERLAVALAAAEEKGWALLVCSIGAELEALKEAQGLLGDTLVHSQLLSSAHEFPTSSLHGEGTSLAKSAHESNGTVEALVPTVQEQDYPHGGVEDEHDVIDPQALFGADEDDQQPHMHRQSPELLLSRH